MKYISAMFRPYTGCCKMGPPSLLPCQRQGLVPCSCHRVLSLLRLHACIPVSFPSNPRVWYIVSYRSSLLSLFHHQAKDPHLPGIHFLHPLYQTFLSLYLQPCALIMENQQPTKPLDPERERSMTFFDSSAASYRQNPCKTKVRPHLDMVARLE